MIVFCRMFCMYMLFFLWTFTQLNITFQGKCLRKSNDQMLTIENLGDKCNNRTFPSLIHCLALQLPQPGQQLHQELQLHDSRPPPLLAAGQVRKITCISYIPTVAVSSLFTLPFFFFLPFFLLFFPLSIFLSLLLHIPNLHRTYIGFGPDHQNI